VPPALGITEMVEALPCLAEREEGATKLTVKIDGLFYRGARLRQLGQSS
jgi:hypothetical protein